MVIASVASGELLKILYPELVELLPLEVERGRELVAA